MRYPIILNPDERLHRTNRPVEMITDEVIDLLEGLRETMIAHDGIGIAAPQIGKNIQVAIVEVEEGEYLELINPEVIDKKGANRDIEGCLSIPHVYGVVERASEITVRYYDREGDEMEIQAFDYLARAIQHEIDHLHGILFTEKMIEQIPEDQLENYMEEHEND